MQCIADKNIALCFKHGFLKSATSVSRILVKLKKSLPHTDLSMST